MQDLINQTRQAPASHASRWGTNSCLHTAEGKLKPKRIIVRAGRWVYQFITRDGYVFDLDEATLALLQPKAVVPVGFKAFHQIYRHEYKWISKVYRRAKKNQLTANGEPIKVHEDKNARKGGMWTAWIPREDYEEWKLTQVELKPVEKAVA